MSGASAIGHDLYATVIRKGQADSAAELRVSRRTVVVLAAGAVIGGSMLLMLTDQSLGLDRVLFEVVSAFGTVGLSTGITAALTAPSQVILCVLMYLGRIGPITMVAALAARHPRLVVVSVSPFGLDRPWAA